MIFSSAEPYSVYSDKSADRESGRKLIGFEWSEFSALAPMSFIFKRLSNSQAGRRRPIAKVPSTNVISQDAPGYMFSRPPVHYCLA
jgi:hypothetical protein